jgi:hypothetical protein
MNFSFCVQPCFYLLKITENYLKVSQNCLRWDEFGEFG